MLLLLAATVAGRLADAASTYLALSLNPLAEESNPFMRPLLPNPPLFLLVQVVGGLLLWASALPSSLLLERWGKRRAAAALAVFPALLSWLPAPHNVMVALLGRGFLPSLYP